MIPLLWNGFTEADGVIGLHDRFDAIVAAGGLNAELARGWTLVRAVDNWLWALQAGHQDMARVCAEIADWAGLPRRL